MKEYTCPTCKKVFLKKVYKKCQAVYCCQACAYKGRTLGYTERVVKNPYNCRRKEARSCLVCQEQYIYRKKTQKYCSRKCFEVALKTTMLGKNNPAYKNGSSYLKRSYRGDDWDTLRLEVYKRDNFDCQDCGKRCVGRRAMTKTNSGDLIQCHHIEDYKINKNNDKSNLITLCVLCHMKRHN